MFEKRKERLLHTCEEVEALNGRSTKQILDKVKEIMGIKHPYVGNTTRGTTGNISMESEEEGWEERVS